MNFLQTKLNEMKKRKEEGNKGFSLVELIIVIAIMAILVGIVGTQVIPYINKSKESKDLQIINSYSTAAVTAYSENADKLETAADGTIEINVYDPLGNDAELLAPEITEKTYKDIKTLQGKMKSSKGQTISKIVITIDLKAKEAITQAYASKTGSGSSSATTDEKVFSAVKADL